MNSFDCEQCRLVAPDLALGMADGDERAAALAHVGTCAACRRELAQLTLAADALLLVGPSAEPSPGFETSILERMAAEPQDGVRKARRPRRWLAVAAAVVLVVFGAGLLLGTWRGGDAPVAAPEQGDIYMGVLGDSAGQTTGQVTAHEGHPSELVVRLTDQTLAGTYTVRCDYGDGRSYTAGVLAAAPTDADFVWSTSVVWPIDDLERVVLVDADGAEVLSAAMRSE